MCESLRFVPIFIYYEQQIKRELKGIHVCGSPYNERLKPKTDQSTQATRIRWVPWGTGTLKDRDEVNRRESNLLGTRQQVVYKHWVFIMKE